MNRADHWAAQETGPVMVPDWSEYEKTWDQNKDRWQLLEQDPPTRTPLENIFESEHVRVKTFMSLEKTSEGVAISPTMTTYIKRLFVVWKQDTDPRAPITADLDEAVALSETDYASNQAAWQYLMQTVGTWMQRTGQPLIEK
ncbi:hypothetical protein [Arthrobacter alpinus]|uniref:hypothetical protein n=1 Tax=Arthrobacter alpinus TaxID=656366 RepID=UPI0012FEE773|nr:hypothetical protein [Arthrobacter alpinus]